jgi:ABC-type transport system involved in cytochrome c biogenesis permease component
MSFLPIVERELRVASRRPATYWLRLFLALAVFVIWFFLLVLGQGSVPVVQRGQILFQAIGVIALAFSLLAGVFLTADCLSEEKREGTLGLLFLTDLKGYDVVLGKLIATSLHAFYGLLAVLPLLALPLLLGGVTVAEFWRISVALLSTLFVDFYALSWVGMWMALQTRRHHRAVFATIARVMLTPCLMIVFLVFLTIGGRNLTQEAVKTLAVLWFGLSAVIALAFAKRAKNGLLESRLRPTSLQTDSTTDAAVSSCETQSQSAPLGLAPLSHRIGEGRGKCLPFRQT